MEKIFVLVLSAALALSLTGCKTDAPAPENNSTSGQVEIANPFISCDSMSAAAELAGFELNLPDGADKSEIRVIEGEMINVDFSAENGSGLSVRKAIGSEDISGDYNSYAETQEITVGSLTATLKGSDGKFNTAIWTDGEYSFALSCPDGMSQEEMSAIIAQIK